MRIRVASNSTSSAKRLSSSIRSSKDRSLRKSRRRSMTSATQEACQRGRQRACTMLVRMSANFSRESFLSLSPGGFHRITYLDWGKHAAKHVVVCVHGLSRNSRDFDFLARDLARDGRVICPDVVGRGDSEWLTDKGDYSF